MTQTVWGDDICPVRTQRRKKKEKKKRRVRAGLLKAAPQKILCYIRNIGRERERGRDGRRDLWAESKVNNYNIMSHFFGERLKEDHLSRLIGNFLCLLRIISHVVAFDGVV